MADDSVKTIKERIKLLRDLKKEGKELSAIQEQELRTLRAQKKEYAGLSKWQKDLLNKGDLRLNNEKIAHKFILKQKEAEKDIAKWLTKKAKVQGEYAKKEATLNKKLEKLVKDGDAYKRVQAEIVDLQKQGAKEVGGYDKYIEHAEQQKSLNIDLAKIQEDQIANQMKAAQGKLEESDIAAQLVQIAGLEKKLKEDSSRLSKEETDQIKAQISNSKSMLDTAEANNDVAKARLGMESKMDDVSGGLIGKMKGMKAQAAQFNKVAAKNPYIALAMILVGIIALGAKLVKQTMELRKEFGLSVGETVKLQGAMMGASAELYLLGVSAEEVKATAGALIDEFGGVNNVTKDILVSLGEMHAHLGVAGADAVKLLGALEGVSSASRETLMAQMKVTGELAQAAGVAPAKVMKDLADNTGMFADFAVDGTDNLQKAAIQANKLGINMGTVSNMAESLLDFEGSIEASMEASMMLGKQINTDKARQFALAGQLDKMQEEVMKQIGNEADFAKMNVLQRRSLAKAFGLSTEELSKMVRDQEKINNMTASEKLHRDAMAKVMESLRKVWAAFLSIGKLLLPVVIGIGIAVAVAFYPITLAIIGLIALGAAFDYLTKKVPILGTVLGTVLALMTAIWIKSKMTGEEMSGGIMKGAKGMASKLKDKLSGGLKDKLSGGGDDKGGGIIEKAKEKFTGGGKKGKGGGKPLGGMFDKFDAKKALGGAAALLIISVALSVTAKALQEFSKVSWGDMGKAGVALLGLVLVLAGIGAIMMSGVGALAIIAGAAAMLIMAAALLVLGIAIQAIGKGFDMLAQGLGSFLPIITTLAPMANAMFVLAGAFTALGFSMAAMALGALALLPALPVLIALNKMGWFPEKKPAEAASPVAAMAEDGVVNKETDAKIGEKGKEAVVPPDDKFDLKTVEDKLDILIAQDLKLMNTLTKKVGDIGVAG